MSTTPARVLLSLVISGIWLTALPGMASADDCATRAARITAGQVPSNEADPDCKKAGVIGTTVAVAAASTAVAVGAVQLGLRGAGGAAQPAGGQPGQGGGAGPVVTGMYSGPEAIDILVKSGLATPVTDASGKPVWETDPNTGQPLRYPNGDPVPKIKPAAGFDNLGGNPVSRVVGESIDRSTGRTDQVQTQTISRVTGFGGRIRPDGTIDPNVSITVDQGRAPDGGFPWTQPVEPPAAAAMSPQTPPPQTPPEATTPQTPPQTTPPQTPPKPPQGTPPQTPPQGPTAPGPVASTVADTIKKINMARSAYNSKYTPPEVKEKMVDEGVKLTGLNRELVKAILGMSRENWAVISGLIKTGAIGVDSKIGDIIALLPSQNP